MGSEGRRSLFVQRRQRVDTSVQVATKKSFRARLQHFLGLEAVCLGLLVSLAAVIHAPALSGEFIWDDTYLAHDNPLIKSPLFALEVFRHHLFLDSLSAHYRPVQNLTFIVDYFFWNDNTYGFHLTNVFLHALSGVLLYFLGRRVLASFSSPKLSDPPRAAAFALALLWTVHPVHSAAIDYISGRADSLAFVLAAGGWLLFLRAEDALHKTRRICLYSVAALSALLALCARETACLWLVLFMLHTLAFRRSIPLRRKCCVAAACLVLAITYAGLRQLPEQRDGPGSSPGWSYPVRAVLIMRALGDYGRLLVWPANLHMERTVVNTSMYDSNTTWRQSSGTEYLSVMGLGFAALLAVGCSWPGPGRRLRIFGACWFLIGFLPISNLFDLNATVAEHWLYLPSVGALLFLAGAMLDLPRRSKPLLAGCAAVAVVALSLCAAKRSSDWTTAEHFYERTAAAGGTSVRVYLNLGQLYAQRGEYERAEKIFRRILSDIPSYTIAQTNLGNVLYQEGRKKEAQALFAAAAAAAPNDRKTYPRTWLAAINLAAMERQNHNLPGALQVLEKARADYPSTWEVVSLEAETLRGAQNSARARELVADFVRHHWWHYDASLALGRLYANDGDVEDAITALRQASRLDVHEVEALNLIAEMRLHQNRFDEACRTQRLAVARQPDAPRQYLLLSDILEKMGQPAEARVAIEQGMRLQALVNTPVARAN